MQRDAVLLFVEVLFNVFPDQKLPGGAPLNVARHLRAFGLNPVLITCAGADADRSELVRLLRDFGLDTRGVQIHPTHPTGRVLVESGAQGHEFSVPPDQAHDFINAHLARITALSAAPAAVAPRLALTAQTGSGSALSRSDPADAMVRCVHAAPFAAGGQPHQGQLGRAGRSRTAVRP